MLGLAQDFVPFDRDRFNQLGQLIFIRHGEKVRMLLPHGGDIKDVAVSMVTCVLLHAAWPPCKWKSERGRRLQGKSSVPPVQQWRWQQARR